VVATVEKQQIAAQAATGHQAEEEDQEKELLGGLTAKQSSY
jgi:hypothetical protein